ncbi:MAG: MAPEG family protein [Oleiphilaceae bacterium]|uniref:MAPEG family protein n=1 Tax=Oleiphilus sp. HI0125 TaxID=1822266 RepID=UPI0007C2ABEE|nr:MAPEG family protein [Oleiphilus sp. HI0125]KZZ59208.1 hypothetical protein A3762_05645 [Oleiphilus sp. HI0125]MCH2159368.1 MAPEG family protein [Oleiphilaceae bacterium]
MGSSLLRYAPMYAGLLAILIIYLGYRVTAFRRAEKKSTEQNDCSVEMRCAIRAHANALENIPLALVLLFMLELQFLNPILIHVFGGMFLLGRVLHAWGLSRFDGPSFGRFYGMLLTWLAMLGMAILNIWLCLIL